MADVAGIPFSSFLEEALYAAGRGFYERGGRAGRRGDFVTSPEVGPLFGAVLARALDAWWDDLGRPDPFRVEEHGAGPGTLARTVVAAAPACAPALRWSLVERSAAQRARHAEHLPHVGGIDAPGADQRARWEAAGGGPLVASAAGPADDAAPQVVVANELLDNLPFDLFERGDDAWLEVRVETDGPGPSAVLAPADGADAALLTDLAPGAPVGARAPLQRQAGEWIARQLERLVPGGHLLVVDYGSTTADLASRPEATWLRTYAAQGRGGDPLDAPGTQDITVEVCVDQLARAARPPGGDTDQATALRRWGIDALVAEGRASWEAGGPPLDVATLRLRSRVGEAEALLDPTGLGAFRVWHWRT